MPVKTTYDADADALYIQLSDAKPIEGGDAGPVTLHDAEDGRVVGVEVLFASKVLAPGGGVRIRSAAGGRRWRRSRMSRETVRALRKHVTAKCSGDSLRKCKLLDKKTEDKTRMRQLGMLDTLQEASIATLKMDAD